MNRNTSLQKIAVISLLFMLLRPAIGYGNPTVSQASAAITDGFITTWKTTQANESILIPIKPNLVNAYNYTVNWGDGVTSNFEKESATHLYASAGTYTVTIKGEFPAIQFGSDESDEINNLKLYTVESWGDGVWNGMDQAFKGCSNLSSVPNENGPQFAPNASLNEMFRDCSALDGNLNMWNLTNVIDISNMFNGAIKFNGDLSDWNVSNVTNMQYLFANASSFNGDISKWDVSMVQFMDFMFKGAKSFNGEIGEWNVSQVQNMNSMFVDADAFNQDICKWDVANVENMANMFRRADVFNQDLNKWDVSKVTNMADMFSGAPAFNGDISAWNVSHVINMNNMFFFMQFF